MVATRVGAGGGADGVGAGDGYAVSARYDRRRSRVAVVMNTGIPSFPTRLAEGLAVACPAYLADIDISGARADIFNMCPTYD